MDTTALSISQQDATSTLLRQLAARRPDLQALAEQLAPLLTTVSRLKQRLSPALPEDLCAQFVQRLQQRAPALAGQSLDWLAPTLLEALRESAPVLRDVLGDAANGLACLEDDPERLVKLAELYLLGHSDGIAQEAATLDVSPAVLAFALHRIVGPALGAVGRILEKEKGFSQWQASECPCCGSAPLLAMLQKPSGYNDFMVGGGGQRFLHCSLCHTQWRTPRQICPGCGVDDPNGKELLHQGKFRHLRIEWCRSCKAYLPSMDLRELELEPPTEVAALEMMHLEHIAIARGLHPLTETLFNAEFLDEQAA